MTKGFAHARCRKKYSRDSDLRSRNAFLMRSSEHFGLPMMGHQRPKNVVNGFETCWRARC
jgi:hypothetical protein